MDRGTPSETSDQEPVVILGLPGPAYLCDDEHLVELIGRAFDRGHRSLTAVTTEVRRHGGRAGAKRLWRLARSYARTKRIAPPSPIPWRWRRARLAPFLLLDYQDDATRWLIVKALIHHTEQAIEAAERRVGEQLQQATASFDGQTAWVWVTAQYGRARMPIRVPEFIAQAERAMNSGVLPPRALDELWFP